MPEIKKRAFSDKMLKQQKVRLGIFGEQLAADYLVSKGCQILGLNLVYKNFEVDLVVFEPKTGDLVFVEVKTSSTSAWGEPSQKVGRKKLQALQNFACWYLKNWGQAYSSYRFDLMTIVGQKIEHYENITW